MSRVLEGLTISTESVHLVLGSIVELQIVLQLCPGTPQQLQLDLPRSTG